MKPGECIYRGNLKNGGAYLVRYVDEGDAAAMCNYINTLSDEHTFIRFQGEHITLEEEQKYLDGQIEKVRANQAVILLAFCEDELIGIADVKMQEKIEKHIGLCGLTVKKEYRRQGVGTKIFSLALSEASENIRELRILTLGVFANNDVARNMYKHFGFKEYGTLPGGISKDGNFFDHVFMYKLMARD